MLRWHIYNLPFETEVYVYLFSETFKTRQCVCKTGVNERCYDLILATAVARFNKMILCCLESALCKTRDCLF